MYMYVHVCIWYTSPQKQPLSVSNIPRPSRLPQPSTRKRTIAEVADSCAKEVCELSLLRFHGLPSPSLLPSYRMLLPASVLTYRLPRREAWSKPPPPEVAQPPEHLPGNQ